MTAGWAGGLALALAVPVAASAAGRVAIDHAPIDCVPYDRYARIAATGAPADAVTAAQLQFRAEGGGGWYSISMTAEGAEWSAFLPRPIRPLARFEYRIVMRSSDAGEAATPAFSVRVGGDAGCASPAQSSAAVAAPIVVRVPEGAPVVPPVPAGFSPAGVVAADRVRTSSMKELAIGAGLAGGITAAVVLGTREAPRDISEFPTVAFSGTAPPPGTVLSLSRDQLSVFVDLTGEATPIASFFWVFELFGAGGGAVCVSMNARLVVIPSVPATVTLTAPSINGRTVLDELLGPLTFHFEP